MQVVNKLIQINIVVSDMGKAKEFYAEKLGLGGHNGLRPRRQALGSLTFPSGGASITLTT